MSNTPESNIPWWVIILGFILFWPAGLVLLLLNFSGVSLPLEELRQAFLPPSSPRQGQSPAREQGKAAQAKTVSYRYVYDTQQAKTAQPGVSRYTYASRQGGATAQSSPLRVWKQPRLGKLMAASGGVLSFLSSLAFAEKFSFALQHGLLRYAVEWFAPFGFLCAGLFLLGKGIVQTRLARRMKLYQGVIGEKNAVFLSDLALAAGVSESKVTADLQRMIADGYLPLGYVDRSAGRLILSELGYEHPAPQTSKPPADADELADEAILRQIRAVNDAIPDPEMTRKIARIEEITGKILDYQKKDPAKAPKLRQFLNYYLPTTLKILNAYARMDAQGVELFQADAMDITADVDVLERMLDRDGLGASGMTLGL